MADNGERGNGPRRFVPDALIRSWDEIVRQEFQNESRTRARWEENSRVVRNEVRLEGNLIHDFIRLVLGRFFVQPFEAEVHADDPEEKARADALRIQAAALLRISGLHQALRSAAEAACWAQWGWIEVGHPMDPVNLDPVRSFAAPRAQPSVMYQDEWVPVPGSLQDILLSDLEGGEVPEFDPTERMFVNEQKSIAPLIGNTDYGYPYFVAVDPRYFIFPHAASKSDILPWVARLRFLTRAELQALSGRAVPARCVARSELMQIFERVEGESRVNFPEIFCVVDLWIHRERNNPQFSNWHLSWIADHPDYVLFDEPNPYAAYRPYANVTMDPIKKVSDPTLVEDMRCYADAYSLAIKGMIRSMKDMINPKYSKGPGAGLNDIARKQWQNPEFSGFVEGDASQIHKKEVKFDENLYKMFTLMRSASQMGESSDIDQGIAIKGITARQTEALLTATGMKIDDLRNHLQTAGALALMGGMLFLRIFGANGQKSELGKVPELDLSIYQLATSYKFKVFLQDSASAENSEEKLLFTQFLRLLSSSEIGSAMMQHMEIRILLEQCLRMFGQPRYLLRAPQAPGAPGMPVPPGDPAAAGQALASLVSSSPASLVGQHPEREAGSRGGVDLGNMMRGQANVGVGGE